MGVRAYQKKMIIKNWLIYWKESKTKYLLKIIKNKIHIYNDIIPTLINRTASEMHNEFTY